MHKILTIALATAAIGLGSVPAQAVEIIGCGGGSNCLTDTVNVNLVAADDVFTGFGNIGIGGSQVIFTSNELIDLITGQATITAGDSNTTLNQLMFSVADGFTSAEFNLNPLNAPGGRLDFAVGFTTLAGITEFANFSTGDQRFAIVAGLGQTITSVKIDSGVGFGSFTQLRIGQAVAAVPEPGTWMMMLLGFGGMGVAMRSRRRKTVGGMQFA